jgi:hypothetical protein
MFTKITKKQAGKKVTAQIKTTSNAKMKFSKTVTVGKVAKTKKK